MLLSLCMIVRDNAETIAPCLEGIQPWMDEMVLVDTGSRDETAKIAHQLGAQIHYFDWCDDFSAARNESLRHAIGDWIFWMDSDDTISEDNGRRLRALAEGSHAPSTLGYVMQVHCPGIDGGTTIVDHVKLFRNHSQIRFEGRIHEQVLPSLRKLGGEVAWTDIFVTHSGADLSEQGRKAKQERDLRILQQDLQDRPDHPFVHFNLGMTYADMGDDERAIDALVLCLQLSSRQESHVRKAFALLVNCRLLAGQVEAAEETCQEGLTAFPDDPELLFRKGMIAHHTDNLANAVSAYQQALKGTTPRQFSSRDQGITGYKSRHNLALVYLDMNRPDLAEIQWRRIIDAQPTYRLGWRGLGETLLKLRKFVSMEVEIERMAAWPDLRVESLRLKAALARVRNDMETAGDTYREGQANFPEDLDLLRDSCEFLFHHGDPREAEQALNQLAQHPAEAAAAHHNLGALHLRIGNWDKAATALRMSLRMRPNSIATFELLGQALERLDRNSAAEAAFRQACLLAGKETTDQPV